MKRMVVPALALGLAFAISRPVSAGHLFSGLGHRDGCCDTKPACETSCKPKCFSHWRSSCPKPCEAECPKPCGGGHRLKGLFSHFRHRNSGCNTGCNTDCNTCDGSTWGGSGEMLQAPSAAPAPAPAPAPMPSGASRSKIESNYGPRLDPIPGNTTSTRTMRRSSSF